MKISEVKQEYQLQEWSGMLRQRKESGLTLKNKRTGVWIVRADCPPGLGCTQLLEYSITISLLTVTST